MGNSKKESDIQIYYHKYLYFSVFKHKCILQNNHKIILSLYHGRIYNEHNQISLTQNIALHILFLEYNQLGNQIKKNQLLS